MNTIRLVVIGLLLSTAANAQQQNDPAFMQRAISALQTQRNQAFDVIATQAVRVDTLTEDLAKANARIKELEEKDCKSDGK